MSHYNISPYWRSYNTRRIDETKEYENNFDSLKDNWEKWNPKETYYSGSQVTYNNKMYEAKWWTKGDDPSKNVTNSWETPWKSIK